MKQWIKLTVPVIAMTVAGLTAQADQIVGTVSMGGAVTFDTKNLNTATMATFVNPAGFVAAGTGDYLTPTIVTPGSAVSFKNFTFSPLPQPTTPITALWSFSSGGLNYSFNLASITSATVNTADTFLDIEGTGTVDITGFDETPANWTFTVTDSSGGGATFTFGFSSSDTSIPDGGMTVMMLGAALTGLGLIKRKLA